MTAERPASDQASALAAWILALADSKRLLGIRYGEWCTGAPELEADIAATAMAQYELGHARILFGLLADFPEDPRSEQRIRSPAGYRHLPNLDRPFGDWTDFVIANAVVDTALTVALESALGSRWRPLAQRLRKAVDEEEYHFLHGQAWLARLVQEETSGRRLRERLPGAWRPLLQWFGPDEDSLGRLSREGLVGLGPEAMRSRLRERLGPALQAAGLEPPGDALSWEGWDPETRRRGQVELDEESFRLLAKAEAGEREAVT